MDARRVTAHIVGLTPAVVSVAGIPLVNSTTPVLGLPLLGFWITMWAILVPVFLFSADRLLRGTGNVDDEVGQ